MCTRPTLFIISRLTISSRPYNLLNAFILAPQIRLLLTIVRVYKLCLLTHSLTYLLTYLLTYILKVDSDTVKLIVSFVTAK